MPDLYQEILDYQKMSIDREELIENYAHSVVEGMDLDTLVQFAYDMMVENLNELNDVELIEEVNNFSPELLEDVQTL